MMNLRIHGQVNVPFRPSTRGGISRHLIIDEKFDGQNDGTQLPTIPTTSTQPGPPTVNIGSRSDQPIEVTNSTLIVIDSNCIPFYC